MKRTLLLATDFDSYAPQLIEFVAGAQSRGIAKCVLLHVLDTSGLEMPVISKSIDSTYRRLDDMGAPLREIGMETVSRVETGNRSHDIVRVAEQEKVDVIVMGTTAKSNMQRLFEGSVSAAVTWGQKTPTLLLRDDILNSVDSATELSKDWSQNLVVPVDFSSSSARAVLQCTHFDPDSVGKVRLLHVIQSKKGETAADYADQIKEYEFRLSAFAGMLADHGIGTEIVVRVGENKQEEIVGEVRQSGATGIVIGGGGRSSFRTFILGSTSRGVLLESPVPVMVVP
ncbi:MAG: universal stress protein [Coriobacteriia bacterium]|nr:universal stress protein [Coriobacteriia bacterium]MCL2537846.1 universal stress protein [Coriobacteriia bacterium]